MPYTRRTFTKTPVFNELGPSEPEAESPREGSPKVYTVTQLNNLVLKTLEGEFSNIWVEGEITNCRGASSSGHWYFGLKDATSQVDIVAFRGVMTNVRFKVEDGLKVLICGRASLYPQRGRFQVIASLLEPQGAGALQVAFEQLKKKLQSEGLFDESRKRPIPSLPQKIGIVTSPTGAAIKDMLTVINRRFANVEILIYPCKVQGEGAKEEIAAGIKYLNANYPFLDVLLIGRGGGSIEDLWAFNEEIVARAIAGSQIPTISCVGHEIDFTIADFVADLRAPTPSAAAELVVKNKAELVAHLQNLAARLRQKTQSTLNHFYERLMGFARSAVFAKPGAVLETHVQNLDYLLEKLNGAVDSSVKDQAARLEMLGHKLRLLSPQSVLEERQRFLKPQLERLNNAIQRCLQKSNDALKIRAGQLEALSPLAVLSRGYSIAFLAKDNKVIKSASQVKANDSIKIKLHEGEILAEVKKS